MVFHFQLSKKIPSKIEGNPAKPRDEVYHSEESEGNARLLCNQATPYLVLSHSGFCG
jgi:hypothetical protein